MSPWPADEAGLARVHREAPHRAAQCSLSDIDPLVASAVIERANRSQGLAAAISRRFGGPAP